MLASNLHDLALDGYFDVVLDSAHVGIGKPDPRIFELACDGLGVPPQRAWYVGDEPRCDVAGSTQAGLQAILLDPLGAYHALAHRSCANLGEVSAALPAC